MRHWNSQDPVAGVKGSKHSQSWCEKWGPQSENSNLVLHLKSQQVVTIVDNEFQSQPCLTIQYTHNETLEQSRSRGQREKIQTLSIYW